MEGKHSQEEPESGPCSQAKFCKHFICRRIYCFLAWQEHGGISPANLPAAVEGGMILQDTEGKGHCVSRQRRHSAAPILSLSLQLAKGIQGQD